MAEVKEVEKTETQDATTSPKKSADKSAYWTVGRRKEAIARVKMTLGNGDITVNDKPLEEFADNLLKKSKILAPLAATDRQSTFDISVKVVGGGVIAQLDAIAMGIARA